MNAKSTPDQIRARFDADVERFSDLDQGQATAIDSRLCMDLVTEAAAVVTPDARTVLDIGCGAGNYSLRMLQRLPGLGFCLVDLSRPMLDRAAERLSAAGAAAVETVQADVRDLQLPAGSVDVVLAAAVFHHLRTDEEWHGVFRCVHGWLRPGGSFWIVDLVEQTHRALQAATFARYGAYLTDLQGAAFRDKVFDYIAEEDSPRPLMWQLDLLRQAGFTDVDVVHKHSCFAAFGGLRGSRPDERD